MDCWRGSVKRETRHFYQELSSCLHNILYIMLVIVAILFASVCSIAGMTCNDAAFRPVALILGRKKLAEVCNNTSYTNGE